MEIILGVLIVICSIPIPLLFLLLFAVGVFHKLYKENRERAEEKWREKEIWERLRKEVIDTFHIWPEDVHERHVQNEIVRIVNLLAFETASACVRENKAIQSNSFHPSQKNDVSFKKREWSQKRNLALQICPKLKDHMIHFSEFEPLKSYREEHARKLSAA